MSSPGGGNRIYSHFYDKAGDKAFLRQVSAHSPFVLALAEAAAQGDPVGVAGTREAFDGVVGPLLADIPSCRFVELDEHGCCIHPEGWPRALPREHWLLLSAPAEQEREHLVAAGIAAACTHYDALSPLAPCFFAEWDKKGLVSTAQIIRRLKASGRERVALYCAGTQTAELFANNPGLATEVVCIFDGNPALHGTSQAGVPVMAKPLPGRWLEFCDAVVVNSNTFASYIVEELVKELPQGFPLLCSFRCFCPEQYLGA